MYFVARLILIAGVVVYAIDGIMVAQLFTPYGWYILGILAFLAYRGRKKIVAFTSHGTARWLGEDEAEKAGMTKGKGIPLGRLLTAGQTGFMGALNALLDRRLKAKQACLEFSAGMRRKKAPPLVRMPPQTVHVSVYAPSGAGKSTGLIVPAILQADSSCVVLDLSGELMLAVAEAKYRQGFEVHILDPYGVVTQ